MSDGETGQDLQASGTILASAGAKGTGFAGADGGAGSARTDGGAGSAEAQVEGQVEVRAVLSSGVEAASTAAATASAAAAGSSWASALRGSGMVPAPRCLEAMPSVLV